MPQVAPNFLPLPKQGLARVKAVLEGSPRQREPGRFLRTVMPAMTAIVLHVGSRVDPPLMRLTKGRVRLIPIRSLALYTRGAKSGQVRETVLGYLPEGDDFFLVATNGARPQLPGWYYNLRANPEAEIRLRGEKLPVVASFVLKRNGPRRGPV